MRFWNRLSPRLPVSLFKIQGENEFRSVKEWVANATKIRGSANTFFNNKTGIYVVATRLNYYTATRDENWNITTDRCPRTVSNLWMRIAQIFSPLFVNYKLRANEISAKLRPEIPRLQFQKEKEETVKKADAARQSVTDKLRSAVSNNYKALQLRNKLDELLDNITNSMRCADNKERLQELEKVHSNLNDMQEKVLEQFVAGNFDAALQELLCAVDSCGDIFTDMSDLPEILNDLCKQLINERTRPDMIFAALKNSSALGSGANNLWLAAIIKYTHIAYKAEAADALGEKNSGLKKAFITELNKFLPDEQNLSEDSTPGDMTRGWIAASRQKHKE